MKYIKCKDLGHVNCRYIARGVDESEALAKILMHTRKEHPYILKDLSINKLVTLKKEMKKNVMCWLIL